MEGQDVNDVIADDRRDWRHEVKKRARHRWPLRFLDETNLAVIVY